MNRCKRKPMPAVALLAVLLTLALAVGCVSGKKAKKKTFFEKWQTRAEESRGYSPAPTPDVEPQPAVPDEGAVPAPSYDPTTGEALPDAAEEATEPERSLPTDRITMRMHNIDVAVLLRALARAAGQNIMVNEKVQGKASISIADAPWDQVFQGLLKTHGLTYKWEGDILRIVTLEDLNHTVKLLAADSKLKLGRKQYELDMNSLETRAQMVEPLETWVYHVQYTDPDTLRDNLNEFFRKGWLGTDLTVSGKDQGKVSGRLRGAILVDPHTNSLVIQAIRSDIERLRQMVIELDRPTKQILIEANIVEANESTGRELGIQWGGLSRYYSGNGMTHWISPRADLAATGTTSGTTVNPAAGTMANFGAAATQAAGAAGLNIGYIVQRGAQNLLSIQLSALEEEGKLNILSTPRIVTQDNKKAEFESGEEVPIQTVEDGEVKIEYKKALLKLIVKPYVVDKEGTTLKLEIEVTKDEFDFTRTSALGNPVIVTKRAKTEVVLYDGETTVIGGLTKDKDTDLEEGIPWLKDIPILGVLFKGKDREKENQELLIFITPYVLQEHPLPDASSEPPAD